MDARSGVNPAPLIVPSQWPGASCPPNTLAGACTRCGRATEPGNSWNICRSCAGGGPRPDPSTPLKQHPTASCTACRVPLRLPPHYQTAHVLCPPCQALHAAIVKTNPRDRTAQRANPYPVVPPAAKTPRALAVTLAFTYPNLPAPSPTTAPVDARVHTSVNHRQDVLRVCMRFGCGARLPAHVLGDMCEACAGAGLVRPPPAVVQKRVPRRATQRTCPRPRESLDLVRASLLQEAARGPKATTGRKDVEDELEAELVYPDDTPVAIQYPSVTESKRVESKPMEDEDVELELMYPEDIAKTTWTSSPKPQTKPPSPPTTLREVLKDGLQTILARRNLAALSDRSAPVSDITHSYQDTAKPTRTSSSKPQTKPPSLPTTLCKVLEDGLQTIPALQNLAALSDKSAPVSDTTHFYQDTAKPTSTSSLKPQTKSSPPPTTLRELFKDGLQTIPALQNLAAPSDRSAPRRCRMPGCNETLPAQSCMQRCVKCGVGDWKRRKLAAKDTLGPSRCPATDTSAGEMEVTNTLDETSDMEDGSEPPPSSPPSKGTSDKRTGGYSVSSIPSWDSDLTELSSSDSDTESISDSGPEPDPRLPSPHEGTTGLRIRVPLLVTRLPPGSVLRKCGSKRCNIALPKDYSWKTCDACRSAQRTKYENRRRRMMAAENFNSPDLSCRRWRSLSPGMHETYVTLTPETSRPCSMRWCRNRVPLPDVYRWKTCTDCRARARREARRKRDAFLDTQHVSCQHEIVPRFPAYQNRGSLLSSFDAQLKGFVEGQIMYFRAKLHNGEGGNQVESEPTKSEHTPMIFVFVGEYSVVTGQRGDREKSSHDRDHSRLPDKPAALDAMRQEVSSIVLDLECVLRAKFRAGEAFAIDKGGVIMRFTCSLELIAQLRPLVTTTDTCPGSTPPSASDSEANTSIKDEDMPSMTKPPPSPPTVPLVKTYTGELEAVVVPDESHRLFHGRRTVVRYRMVG